MTRKDININSDIEAVLLNADNFVRAETAAQFDQALQIPGGGINKIVHFRSPAAMDSQNVIRMNRGRTMICH